MTTWWILLHYWPVCKFSFRSPTISRGKYLALHHSRMLRCIQPLVPDCPAVASHISNQGKRIIMCVALKWKRQLLPERRLQVTQKYLPSMQMCRFTVLSSAHLYIMSFNLFQQYINKGYCCLVHLYTHAHTLRSWILWSSLFKLMHPLQLAPQHT